MSGPGLLALLGSGETTPVGGQVFEQVARQLLRPYRISILETPAGFELNSAAVAGRVKQYLEKHLQNDAPQIDILPARRKGTPFSPDDPQIAGRLLEADIIFLGPGSPTYAVRQLKDSLVWDMLRAWNHLGTPVIASSAAAIAFGKLALPVYEIYKAGEDPHWKPGLDFIGYMGLDLVVVPHWNNSEGGAELDTRRCFLGIERFEDLAQKVDPSTVILGIDENTAILIDFEQEKCEVLGKGSVTVLSNDQELTFGKGDQLPLAVLGNYQVSASIAEDLPAAVWEQARSALEARQVEKKEQVMVPKEVQYLADRRAEARAATNWPESDRLRAEIQALGWSVVDTPEGQRLEKKMP